MQVTARQKGGGSGQVKGEAQQIGKGVASPAATDGGLGADESARG